MAFNLTVDRANVYTEGSASRIPTDAAYIGKIIAAKAMLWDDSAKVKREADESKNEQPTELQIAFDITEGEYKDYYKNKFDADINEDKKWKGVLKIYVPLNDGTEKDGWTQKSFNTQIIAIEDSNAGYTWDGVLEHLKGKKIGIVYRDREYSIDGRTGFYSEPFKIISVKNAEEQKFRKVPAKKLSNSGVQADGFTTIPDGVNSKEIPF